jgi:hypothetical protein
MAACREIQRESAPPRCSSVNASGAEPVVCANAI